MPENLYSSYADVLSLCQSNEDLENILHKDDGYAPRMRQICEERIRELQTRPDKHDNAIQIEALNLEKNTWALLQAVMSNRIMEVSHTPSSQELLLENPYTPTSSLAQAIMKASPLLTELIVVREWLQETAPSASPPEANNGYWKFTKATIMQGLRTGHGQKEGLVSEMDPDAINRGDGATLAPDDSSYEKNLVQALYSFIRGGKLNDAIEVCRRAHQPWRAASIRGSLFFQWKALSTLSSEEEEEEEEEDHEDEQFSGNFNRSLWKSTCERAALNPILSDQERVLYASLAPSTRTISVLKTACQTWEDHLWADISVICEEKVTRELARLSPGSFWEGGVESLEKGFPELSNAQNQQNEEKWEQEVKKALANLDNTAVADGPPAEHAFHYSQLCIILASTDKLLNSFAQDLKNGKYRPASLEYEVMCRFFAHVCLFLQMIDIPVPSISTQIILETYLRVLEDASQRDLIALYAGALKTNAVERYADFLVSLMLSADVAERRLALTRASEHGLSILSVARVTAEKSVTKAFSMLPILKDPLPSIVAQQHSINDAEKFLIRSIEWTTFTEDTYAMALEHATVILRYFLGAGRIQAAQSLLSLLPDELASLAEPEEMATEYLHYRQFFVIWETLGSVVDCKAKGAKVLEGYGTSREEKANWVSKYRSVIDQAHDQILRLLTTEWLASEDDFDAVTKRRKKELIRIRQLFVPELIFQLHFVLYDSRKHIPGNLKRALELANIVADSRFNLYEDFLNEGGRSLGQYLNLIREAILGGLETEKSSDPFAVITNHPNH